MIIKCKNKRKKKATENSKWIFVFIKLFIETEVEK